MKKLVISLMIVLGIVSGWVALQPHASAMGRFGSENSNYIKADEVVDGSAYLAGDSVRVEGTIKGDLYCASGKDIVITGHIEGDIICAGDKLTIGGTAHNVRVAGQTVRLSGEYSGNVSAFGVYVDTESSTTITGDLTGGAQVVNLGGRVGRDVAIGADKMAVTGNVGRDITGEFTELRVARDAAVGGSIYYTSDKDVVVDGKVSGELRRTEMSAREGHAGNYVDGLAFGLALMLGLILMAIVLALVAPHKLRTITTISGKDVLVAVAIGFLTVFVLPLVLIFIAFTIVGIPIALIVLTVWTALMALSWPVSAYYVGQKAFASRGVSRILATFLGGLALALACLIPYIGALAVIAAIVYGVGMMVYSIRFEHSNMHKK